MYNNPYINNFSLNDRIDNEIERLKQMKTQVQQPAPITQNFQLAPTHSGMKYANTIDDVKKEIVYFDTPYFSKDMSVLWIKNNKGDIKAYELTEIIEKDDKDIQIEYLKSQIEELKGMIKYDANVTNVNAEQNTTNTSKYDETNGTAIKESKSSSIQKISRSKKE
jgi:hypothetical protein